jgi:hypothetical protein
MPLGYRYAAEAARLAMLDWISEFRHSLPFQLTSALHSLLWVDVAIKMDFHDVLLYTYSGEFEMAALVDAIHFISKMIA